MEDLKRSFELAKDDFSEFQKKLCDETVIEKASLLLKSLRVDTLVKPRIFLSAFLLFYFPHELFCKEDDTDHLKEILAKLMTETKETELRKIICEYSMAFKKWSSEDLESLKSQLLHEYHQLNIEILNTTDEDKIIVYKKTQEEILKCAKTIGFDQKILSHCPVVVDTKKYEEEYTMALYDTLHVELSEKKLVHTKQILEYIQKFIQIFSPEEDFPQVSYLEQLINHDACNETEVKSYFSNLYDCLKKIQAVKNDDQLEAFRSYLTEKEVNIPKHLIFLLDCVQSTVDDLENIKTSSKTET